MAINNFKKLAEENERKFSKSAEVVKKNVTGQRNIWNLIGDLIDLYIPNVFSALVGGKAPANSISNDLNSGEGER